MSTKQTLLIASPDEKGLIYKVTSILFWRGVNIERNDEYVDKEKNHFFMRTEFSGQTDIATLNKELCAILPEGAWVKIEAVRDKEIFILCTRENHCLGDLLLRYDSGELGAKIKGVIANHENLRTLSEKFEIPFYHVSSEGVSREAHEGKILALLEGMPVDYVVLAKYMRILSPEFVAHFKNRILNIHHSFLPAFIGANPYKQAHERGVKIIGATAHFVNNQLDEGPIILQDTIKVDHSYTWKEMQKAGRDIEKIVLAQALDLVLQDRVFVHENKTIVF